MSKMIFTFEGKRYEYLINTQVADHIVDRNISDILRWFPDAVIEEIEEIC